MNRNIVYFAGVCVLVTTGFILAPFLTLLFPEPLQGLGSFLTFMLQLWILFGLIFKIIYRMTGITSSLTEKRGKKKLTHEQAEIVGKYWVVWLFCLLGTGAVWVLLFNRNDWLISLVILAGAAVIASIAYFNNTRKIMGHTKEEIFK